MFFYLSSSLLELTDVSFSLKTILKSKYFFLFFEIFNPNDIAYVSYSSNLLKFIPNFDFNLFIRFGIDQILKHSPSLLTKLKINESLYSLSLLRIE